MLTDEKIDEIYAKGDTRYAFARAIEAAATAPLLERIADLEARLAQYEKADEAQCERAVIEYLMDPKAQQAEAQPVAEWVNAEFGFQALISTASIPDGTQLYTSPPKAVPLTDEQADEIALDVLGYAVLDKAQNAVAMGLIRKVEAAHGIGTPATVEKGGA